MPSSLERNGTPGGGTPGVFFVSKVLPLRYITGSDQEPGDRQITVTDKQTNGIGRRRSISSMATPTIRTSTTTESGRPAPSAGGVAMKDSRRWSDLLVTMPFEGSSLEQRCAMLELGAPSFADPFFFVVTASEPNRFPMP